MKPTSPRGLAEQAAHLERLMPEVARNLFALAPDNPALELPIGQLRVCAVLFDGPETLGALGERLGVSSSAVSQLADRLEKAGFVERVTESDDRRVRRLQLSEVGAEMMRNRRQERQARTAAALGRLCPETRAALLAHLEALLDASKHADSGGCRQDPVGVRLNS